MLENRIGQQLGNYRLTRFLGKGGFADVYLGEHLYLKNQVAIKVLHNSLTDKKEQHFLSEAKTLARLAHPNIVRVREFAVEHGIPFLVMDYAPAGTLRDRHPKRTRLSLSQTGTYVKQIATALQYAHNHNIIHRDVKPENMLLGVRQQAMLSDFNISILSPSPTLSTTQTMAGTFPYMAPEQWRENACYASDQYSLGIVVYEWLSGVRPFEGPPLSLAQQHLATLPPRLREKDPSLPEAVESVVLKALAKEPEDRYVSVLMFARALEQACGLVPDQHPDTLSTYLADYAGDAPAGVSRRIFLATSPADNAFTARLKSDLEIRDIIVEGTMQMEHEEEQTRQAIRAAQVVLLLVSPQTPSSAMIHAQLRIAQLYRRRVICLWIADDDIHELLPPGTEGATIIDARGVGYEKALTEIVTRVEREIKPHVELPTPEPAFEPRNPYKGLHAFTQDDASDFFGRDTLVKKMVTVLNRVLNAPSSPGVPGKRLLAVVGPGGVGKSSAVMAGLLPQLQQGGLPSSETWIYLDPMVPGQHPLDALAYTLLSRFPGKSMQNIRQVLSKDSSYGLHQLATSLVQQPQGRVVLLIDQFEELFSPEISEPERQQFIDLLMDAVNEPGGPVIVLLTLRADYYDRPFTYPALGQLIQQQQCVVLPMGLDDLRVVIEQPTTLPDVWLTLEDNLVGDILFEMQGQVGALPLLEFTLDQLFQHRREHQLTAQAYKEIGGVKGALARHAEDTYVALPSEEHQRLARVLFIRLTTPGTAAHDSIRRRAPLAEFTPDDATQAQHIQQTIDAFLESRLITISQVAGITTLEVSHEALIREWSRLKDWIDKAQEDIRLQQMLSKDVAEWERQGRPGDQLYPRSRSKEFKVWQEHNLVSKQEAVFLKASARRQTTTRIGLAAVALLILLLIIPTSIYAIHTFTPTPNVTNLNDSGSGSLRQAIDAASPGSSITFESSLKGTIHLVSNLTISKNLTIEGPGANAVAIKLETVVGLTLEREILINPDVNVHIAGIAFKDSTTTHFIYNEGTLSLDKCVFSGNTMTGQNGSIYNSGMLTMDNSIISGNTLKPNSTEDASGGGISNSNGILLVSDSTVSNNTVISYKDNLAAGGGISNDNGGNVTLMHTIVSDNKVIGSQSAFGGGIVSQKKGKLAFINSTISSNSVSSPEYVAGGGIFDTGGTVTLSNSIVSGNTINSQTANSQAESFGGGIFADNILTVSNSTVSDNTAKSEAGSIGGGILAFNLTITNSTISDNRATSSDVSFAGGIDIVGVFNNDNTLKSAAKLTLSNSTIAYNSAISDKGIAKGGGILVDGGQGTITFCTVYGNAAQSSSSSGGGIRVSSHLYNQITLKNTIVANNQAGSGPDISGTVITNGYNLIQNFSGVMFDDPLNLHSTTDLPGTTFPTLGIDPQLKNNGGPTQTLALLAGSPAIGKVPHAFCDSTTDQRGVKRPQEEGTVCDIGAFEYTFTK